MMLALFSPKARCAATRAPILRHVHSVFGLSPYPNYTVVYRPDTAPLQIVTVLHGKRNIRRILKQRP
jgi:hypothetical protein